MSIRIFSKSIFLLFLICLPAAGYSADAYIVYTANINGALQHCNCGDKPRGGIDRIKTFLQNFKSVHQNSIIIDGGDMMNSYPYPELNRTVLQAISLLPYDVIVPGDQEFIEGEKFTELFRTSFSNKLLLSNSELIPGKSRIFEFPGMRISVSAILAPEVFTFIPMPGILDLKESIEPPDANAFRILVYHGRIDGLKSFLDQHQFDLVFLAHEQYEEEFYIGQIPVAGVGRDGESAVVVKLHRKDGKVISDIDYHAINTELISDPDITELISKFESGKK